MTSNGTDPAAEWPLFDGDENLVLVDSDGEPIVEFKIDDGDYIGWANESGELAVNEVLEILGAEATEKVLDYTEQAIAYLESKADVDDDFDDDASYDDFESAAEDEAEAYAEAIVRLRREIDAAGDNS